MMGTPAEKETTQFVMDFLNGAGLSPYTEKIQWSNAYVLARKAMFLLFIPWLVVFNLGLRTDGTTGGIISILLSILAVLFVTLFSKTIKDDKFSYLGQMATAKNVICDIPSESGKEVDRLVYLTAHTDSVGSSMPKVNMLLTIGSMLFFLISLGTTFAGGIAQLAGKGWVGSGPETIKLFLLIISILASLMILIGAFARRVNTSPGAIDNGSGAAILLGLAEYFQGKPLPDTALRFIFCTAEEWGLYGSKGYVKTHRDELVEGIDRDVLINVDMVGSELAYVKKAGLIFKKPLNKELNQLISAVAEKSGIEARAFSTPLAGNSDHAPFRKLKMETAFFRSKKDTKKIHKPLDTLEGVNPQKMEDAVTLLKAVVLELDQNPLVLSK